MDVENRKLDRGSWVRLSMSGLPTYRANFCPLHCGGAASHQDYVQPFCTVKVATARGFCEDLTNQPREARPGLRWLSLIRQLERKKEMGAYPLELEPFV